MIKRTILAFVISMAFVLLYTRFVMPLFVTPQPARTAALVDPSASTDSSLAVEPFSVAANEPPASAVPEPVAAPAGAASAELMIPQAYQAASVSDSIVSAATDVVSVELSLRSGSIAKLTLLKFNDFQARKSDPKAELVLLRDFCEGLYPTELVSLDGADLGGLGYSLRGISQKDGNTRVAFVTEVSGLRIVKDYVLYPGKYGVGLDITFENLASARQVSYDLIGPAGIPAETGQNKGLDVQWVIAGTGADGVATSKSFKPAATLQLLDADHVTAAGEKFVYGGAVNQYFASVIRPAGDVPVRQAVVFPIANSLATREDPQAPSLDEVRAIPKPVSSSGNPISRFANWLGGLFSGSRDPRAQAMQRLQNVYFQPAIKLSTSPFALASAGADGSSVTHSYLLYCGPKDKDPLAAFDASGFSTGFPALLDYGKYLDWFVRLLLRLLRLFHAALPNWGMAIILLTVLVRICLHPLTARSQASMAKMQKLQPEIKKLQEKYKNDKQKLGAEQMKLMKEGGANPLGGCLPMLIQLPVFFALYRAINVSIELRQAPFFWWITDLARPDRLFTMGSLVLPVIHNELNLLPLLMLVAMVIQQKTSPAAATPEAQQQQKLMAFIMPIFIGVLLYRVASGLNLYIFTSTALGALEQWIIRRRIEAKELA
jgi:YidC/Oxa1 family membrane protein insertase